ncbi:hypothetical protein IAE39_005467 [Pseudomonas sp. S37]|nr:hypothetical protein [Pseudomonas sp. S37]
MPHPNSGARFEFSLLLHNPAPCRPAIKHQPISKSHHTKLAPTTEGRACMEKAMIEATEKQLNLLWHTLGLNPGCRTGGRNHFLTSPGYDAPNNLDVLVEAGLMTRGKAPAFCDANDVVYRATPEGNQSRWTSCHHHRQRESTPGSIPISTSASATTASPISSESTSRRSSSAAPGATTNTGWSATHGEVPLLRASPAYPFRALVAVRVC